MDSELLPTSNKALLSMPHGQMGVNFDHEISITIAHLSIINQSNNYSIICPTTNTCDSREIVFNLEVTMHSELLSIDMVVNFELTSILRSQFRAQYT